MSDGVRCMWMRGGTSKGGYFLAEDLPADTAERDRILLRVMGSPDERQTDGMGGADPLTSKVAVVKRSERDDADVEYLFLQVFVDQAIVTDAQNCGNILAGVGPFAIERGLVAAQDGETDVRIFMVNTGQVATARVSTPNGQVSYVGDARIDGVPGMSAAVPITFADTAGSSCGALLPTGNPVDVIDGVEVTLIDNGMPVVILRASDMGITGTETREELEANQELRAKLESIRLQAGPLMNLGDVRDKSVPKMSMVSAATNGGTLSTRTFIPHRCHASIGVLGAVSVATAAVLPGSPAAEVARLPEGTRKSLMVEHPIGEMTVILDIDEAGRLGPAALLRTARKLFDGEVFAHNN
ncbi:TPA: 4-oxalomesaconate tautomerase [Pseudomonas aeruginosa]|uniref:4-oxalomesaconate tautomerase n=1 Tax=Pseudomonadaceae TaxID=135621 RepID=UPI0018C73811|nr:4-oxalomesaconate tautomerase [Pseudomonas aeruginosa]MBG4378408.1 4-oxalomesaconate tautomerase [Pseudomonas aeruginosa]MBI8227235.1 4-oxalomesaconate tautomerase [Pseudomonas aeruginosa]MCT5070604.1 4-oxalomesaconate tautomerase [Pseudomonas aeruginosa]MDP5707300.1 4-oxalomesaconate tautomerase [Pseudomonas aeruginosa]HBO0353814.1 4-oxalomesaconate tautomerase [Pseudomonas aeruginosa]